MKRSALIIGPTPPFLRWAIELGCSLREIDKRNLPDSTFRQLRAVREVSRAIQEERVFEGIAFHPKTQVGEPLIGFPIAEVLEVMGGESVIQSACNSCPANALDSSSDWAGCFGLIRLDQGFNGAELESVIERSGLRSQIRDHYLPTDPQWFGLWTEREFFGQRLFIMNQLLDVFSASDTWGQSRTDDWVQPNKDWDQLRVATERCLQHSLEIHIEYFPSGVSDGQKWTLNAHCSRCKSESVDEGTTCKVCGQLKQKGNPKKRKVLGLRPYMKMEFIVGRDKSDQLVNDYLRWKERTEDERS